MRKFLAASFLLLTAHVASAEDYSFQSGERRASEQFTGSEVQKYHAGSTRISMTGVVGMRFFNSSQEDRYKISAGGGQVGALYYYSKDATAGAGAGADYGAVNGYTGPHVVYDPSSFSGYGVVAADTMDGATDDYVMLLYNKDIFGHSGSDARVLGDYSSEFSRGFSTDASMSMKVANYAPNDLIYGASIELSTNTHKLDTNSGTAGLSSRGASIFIDSVLGRVEAGTIPGAQQKMRIDASRIATVEGGIDGSFYRYFNTEGHYSDAVLDQIDASDSLRGSSVRHPFHVLPRLYSEYSEGDFPWLVQGRPSKSHVPPKVSYYSKDYSGFSFAVSYTHDQGDVRESSHRDAIGLRRDYTNVIDGGVSYEKEIEGFNVKFAFTGELGKHQDSNYNDLEAFQVGIMGEYTGVSVVASYANMYKSGLPKKYYVDDDLNGRYMSPSFAYIAHPSELSALDPGDTQFWSLGACYAAGPAMLSASYFHSTTAPMAVAAENTFKHFNIGVEYDLAEFAKNTKFVPYVSWSHIDTQEHGVDKSDNNKGDVWFMGVRMDI